MIKRLDLLSLLNLKQIQCHGLVFWYVIMLYPGHINWLYDINTKEKNMW